MMEFRITRVDKILVMLAMMLVPASLQIEIPNSSEVQKVEKTLLSILGLKKRPIVDREKAWIPQAMMDLYNAKVNHEYESTSLPLPGSFTRSANVMRSYTHQESSIDERFLYDHRFRLNFNIKDFPENEIITSAELKLTIIVPKENHKTDCLQRISVYDIVQPGIKGKSKPTLRLIDTKIVNTTLNHTVATLDVLPIIERWILNHKINYGLLVEVKSPTGDKVASHVRLKRNIHQDEWKSIQPLLFVYSDDLKTSKTPTNRTEAIRRKRSNSQPKSRRRRNECSRHALYVDFEKVGWTDWILAPPGYDAFYCAGECPMHLGDHMNVTNHAIVQTLVHDVHPSIIPKPCCVPTSLSEKVLLYLDDTNSTPVLRTYRDMAVEGCGCR